MGQSVPPVREHQVHWDFVFKNKTESVRVRSLASGLYTCTPQACTPTHYTKHAWATHIQDIPLSRAPVIIFPEGKIILPTPTPKPLIHLGLPHTWAPHLRQVGLQKFPRSRTPGLQGWSSAGPAGEYPHLSISVGLWLWCDSHPHKASGYIGPWEAGCRILL